MYQSKPDCQISMASELPERGSIQRWRHWPDADDFTRSFRGFELAFSRWMSFGQSPVVMIAASWLVWTHSVCRSCRLFEPLGSQARRRWWGSGIANNLRREVRIYDGTGVRNPVWTSAVLLSTCSMLKQGSPSSTVGPFTGLGRISIHRPILERVECSRECDDHCDHFRWLSVAVNSFWIRSTQR